MFNNLVSCVIPTYKRSDSLLRAVESVLNQTYKEVEVVVVDDNHSNDDYSKEVQRKIRELNDERVRYVQQDKHINGAVARNVGIKNAKGRFVAFLDDDDEWSHEKIQKQIDHLSKNTQAKGISCLYTIYNNGVPVRKCPPYSPENLHKKVLGRDVSVFTSTTVFDREALLSFGGFDEDLLRHQDLQLLTDFLSRFEMVVLNEYLVKLHSDIGGNRPNTDKLIEIKKIFLNKMKSDIEKYSTTEIKAIYAAHHFEIVFSALKEKKVKIAIQYLTKIGFNLSAYKKIISRIRERRRYTI